MVRFAVNHVRALAALALLGAVACEPPRLSRICDQDGICMEPDGNRVYADGGPLPCELGGPCEQSEEENPTDDGDPLPEDDAPVVAIKCSCTGADDVAGDADDDCIEDARETSGGGSDAGDIDTDNDGINDGCEDRNRNGTFDPGETNPRSADSGQGVRWNRYPM